MAITDKHLDDLKALAEAATAGPWEALPPGTSHSAPYLVLRRSHRYTDTMMAAVDAAFIARSRTDVPELCKALREAREVLARLVASMSGRKGRLRSTCDVCGGFMGADHKPDCPVATAERLLRGEEVPSP